MHALQRDCAVDAAWKKKFTIAEKRAFPRKHERALMITEKNGGGEGHRRQVRRPTVLRAQGIPTGAGKDPSRRALPGD